MENAFPSAREAHQARAARQFEKITAVVRVTGIAIAVALGLRTFVVEPFNIPSESMLPTLLGGDYLFVAKWPYGYSRYSLPLAPPLFGGRIAGAAPRRGDVVVFKTPRDNRTDFIKRVIGLPGDRVRMIGGSIELNGTIVPRVRTTDFVLPMIPGGSCHGPSPAMPGAGGGMLCRYPRYLETLGGRTYAVLDEYAGDPPDDTALVTVPTGHYFVEGDNRDDSADSRMSLADGGVGMVPAQNLVGRAEVIFFSTSGTAVGNRPSTWLDTLRLSRVGTRL
ncbi:signal peptidase I [Glacieibacterium megasporae]|uniref:signal peptidase I n=1 Tax=Glacieibacterium megasporae TaxID=2835787 RepID=UPI001C1E4E31|nr:signal peptidase I [Polymorphobacter megasporae]UAJ09225.1 signal peptidase I [Polymorphobacter megasporae]